LYARGYRRMSNESVREKISVAPNLIVEKMMGLSLMIVGLFG
jgi:hypothetical protein